MLAPLARARTGILFAPIIVLGSLLSACIDDSGSSPAPDTAVSGDSELSSTVAYINGSSATLSWSAPTENTNGSALTDLAGYNIYYGTDISALDQHIAIPTTGLTSYQIDDLDVGTYFFAITSYSTDGAESAYSAIVSATIS
jgi:hypothetical protein